MARRRYFDEATLTRLRDMPASDALVLLALYVKEDPTYVPVKTDRSQRWHVRTAYGEYEILTTGYQWYDMGQRRGGGGAIDLAEQIRATGDGCAVVVNDDNGGQECPGY